MERRVAELTREFFQAKLRLTPQSVEVRTTADVLVVSVRGFLAPAERAMMDSPGTRSSMEEYYRRLFDQLEPLLRAGVREAAGRSLLEFQTLLNLSEDESLFVVTLGVGTSPRAGPHSPEHGNFGGGMP
jgi:uncharacterized protein YbcI